MGILFISFVSAHVANFVAGMVTSIATYRLYRELGVPVMRILSYLFLTWGLTNMLLLAPIVFQGVDVELLSTLNPFLSSFAPALYLLFVDQFEGEISVTKTSVAVTTIVGSFFLTLAAIFTGEHTITSTNLYIDSENLFTMRWSPLASLLLFPSVLLTAYWTLKEYNELLTYSVSQKQVKQVKRMRLGGFLMFVVGPIFGILGVVLVSLEEEILGTWASEIVGYLFVSFGVFYFGITYASTREIAFLMPQRIEAVLVIHDTGLPVYNYNFRPDLIDGDLDLASGVISAIGAVMSEAFSVTSEIDSISFRDKLLLLTNADEFTFLLVAERYSSFVKNALSQFKERFMQHVVPNFDIADGKLPAKEEPTRYLLSSFGFQPVS